MHLQSPPRLNAPAARAGPNEAQDAAPTPQLQSAQILHPPRNPPASRSQPWMTSQSLQRPAALASTAICLLPPQGQPGHKRRDLRMEDSSTVDTTLPISSSMFDGFHSPTGSFSNVIELSPPPLLRLPWARSVRDMGIPPQLTAGT